MDSPGHNPNGQSRYKSQTQTSPNKQHFDTAYHNLLVKLSSEPPETEEQALITRLLLTPQVEGELAKHHLFSKKSQENSSLRLTNQAAELNTKHSKLAEDLLPRELKECSFNPEILVTSENEHHRSLPQFLASQTKFIEKLLRLKLQATQSGRKHYLRPKNQREIKGDTQTCSLRITFPGIRKSKKIITDRKAEPNRIKPQKTQSLYRKS